MDDVAWTTTNAIRSLRAGLATFQQAVDRVMNDRALLKCRWCKANANVVWFEVSSFGSGEIVDTVATCSRHAYPHWKCAICGADAKDTERSLLIFSTPAGMRCHRHVEGGFIS